MSYECVFRVTANGQAWEKSYSSLDEFEPVRKLCVSREIYGPGMGAFVLIRTNSWKNIAKDLFLPSFVNQIEKTHHIALKLFALITDLLTLPIRLIGLYFRYKKNSQHPKESHPLYQYLLKEEVPPDLLKGEFVRVDGTFVQKCHDGRQPEFIEGYFSEAISFIDIPANRDTEGSKRGSGSDRRVTRLCAYQFRS